MFIPRYRLRTGSFTSRVFTIPLLQELSNELSTIWKLLDGVATHAAANMPEKSTPKPTQDATRWMTLFAATLPTQTAHRSPPVPLRWPRFACQRSCRHSCSAGPELCGPRRRDRGEVSEDAKCPERHETRRQTCAVRARSGNVTSPLMGKRNASGCVLSG